MTGIICKCPRRNIDTIGTRKPRSEGNFCLEITIMAISFFSHKKDTEINRNLKEVSIFLSIWQSLQAGIRVWKCSSLGKKVGSEFRKKKFNIYTSQKYIKTTFYYQGEAR